MRVADRTAADRRLTDLEAKPEAVRLREWIARPGVRPLLAGIADHSSYLWHLVDNDPDRFQRILSDDPLSHLNATLASLESIHDETEADVMRRLRLAKQDIALLVAAADLGGVWALEAIVQALSRGAGVLIAVALRYLLRRAATQGKLLIEDLDAPERGCGLAILGLGKLGGRELNYSSDVDLIAIFDPSSPAIVDRDSCKALYVRMVQDLVRILQQATADGYVLRVDLRLRPDPGSNAVAMSMESAFLYYESVGQNWERAALIKARTVAGDASVGQTFMSGLSPFVWRRYFDYAAIADIHAMKRQIHAAKGHATIAVAGHNVKLGRGGIREIEFFVQTQQLIFGGKSQALRGSRTLEMLRQLSREGRIGRHAVADLRRAYDFLRTVEHRLQMLVDEQTHVLPTEDEALERFARFCGFQSAARFSAVLERHFRAVVHHYALLFENAPGLHDPGGNLVFTGTDDDPETIETLDTLGFKSAASVSKLIREWHAGRRAGVRTERARERLTELVPRLLVTFSQASDPDGAVAAFDKALDRMPAAAELFSILIANVGLRTLFGDILGSAPHLAAEVALRPHLLDGAISPLPACLDDDEMEQRAEAVVRSASTTEELLDAIRDFHREEHFLIGVAVLSGDLAPELGGCAYSALATGIIRVVLRRLVESFAAEHGRVPDAKLAIVAMGRLGSNEMTATSDLDLVFLYDYNPDHSASDGTRALPATQYFARLAQRLVSHLTVATRRGKLYDVDMRLRPSGRQGPLATKLSAFASYQRDEAATWEHMALTRARVVASSRDFGQRVTDEISTVLSQPPRAALVRDIVEMRNLIEREKPPRDRWDLKLVPGGLTDIEFVAQYLALQGAYDGSARGIGTTTTLKIAAETRMIEAESATCLIAAHRLFTNVIQIVRLALGDDQSPDNAGEGVKRRLAAATGVPDFSHLLDEIATTRQAVREIFRAVLSPG